MRIPRSLAAVAAAVALTAGASQATAEYDEVSNWLRTYDRTIHDFTTPSESVQVAQRSLANAVDAASEPERIPDRSPQQFETWPNVHTDPADWSGTAVPVHFANQDGRRLKGTIWVAEPSVAAAAPTAEDGRLPALVLAEGFLGNEDVYYWAAQSLADAGYVFMTFDYAGQGESEGQGIEDSAQDTRDAIEFLLSTPSSPVPDRGRSDVDTVNPFHMLVDADRLGTIGNSAGAAAVQAVGDYGGKVKAISAWTDMRASYAGNAPIQGQGADYESWILPPQPDIDEQPNPEGKLAGFDAARARGIDTQEVVIESASHLSWSHAPYSYSSEWAEEVALVYSLAWFDRYLADDLERGGATATERLTSTYEADDEGHGLSKKFQSAYSVRDLASQDNTFECRDMVQRPSGCTAP